MRYILLACATIGVLLGFSTRTTQAQLFPPFVGPAGGTPTPLFQHVVIIVQENRTVDNMFQGYCSPVDASCADTSTSFTRSDGTTGTLVNTGGIAQTGDPGHTHQDFVAACNRSYLDISKAINSGDSLTVTINGHAVSASVTGPSSSRQTLAIAIVSAINADATDSAIVAASFLSNTDVAGVRVEIAPISVPNSYSLTASITSTTGQVYAAPQISGGCDNHGFDREICAGGGCGADFPFVFVDPSFTTHYTNMAAQGTFMDRNFEEVMGPSAPSHQWLSAADGGDASEYQSSNPGTGAQGCAKGGTAKGIFRPNGNPFLYYPGAEQGAYFNPACSHVTPIYGMLENAGLTWKSYVDILNASAGTPPLWDNCATFASCCGTITGSNCTGPEYVNHMAAPASQILTDINAENLANVTWVTTSLANSDHPGSGNGGPAYVAGIVNAIGTDNGGFYWTTQPTMICVVWDDWGGFFDHATPPPVPPGNNYSEPFSYGMRVPLICDSPYSKQTVDHTTRDSTSLLHFLESDFHMVGPIGVNSIELKHDDLFGTINATPRPFVSV